MEIFTKWSDSSMVSDSRFVLQCRHVRAGIDEALDLLEAGPRDVIENAQPNALIDSAGKIDLRGHLRAQPLAAA
jgi:hypothetical protein